MANSLPPGIPLSFWDDYKKQTEGNLAAARRDLAPLESGEMHLGERNGNEPWRDTTQEWVVRHKHTIGTLESILMALKRRGLP